jgi:hypothetical protein
MLQREKSQPSGPGLHADMTGLCGTVCDSDSVLLNATVSIPHGSYRYLGSAVHERASTRRLALDLCRALPRGEFQVFYQPIVSAATQQIVSFEALLRWNHPLRGRMAPDDFVHLAEETGLIDKIGEWVLRQACAQCAAWPSHIRVAVNFSATQFRDRNIAAMVASALEAVNLSANRLATGRRRDAGPSAAIARIGRSDRDGRLRNWLLCAQLSAALPLRQDKD